MLWCGEMGGLFSQERIVFNPNYPFFLLNPGVYNPAQYSFDKAQVGLHFRNGIGSFSRIRDVYLEALVKKQNHRFGVNFFSEQQSSLFSKNKIQGVYNYEIELSKDLFLTFGTEFGLANIQFSGSNSSPGGSDVGFDLSIGSLLKFRPLKIGLVIHQIPEPSIVPIGFEFVLNRYYDIHGQYEFDLNQNWSFESGAMLSVSKNQTLWMIENKLAYDEKYGVIFNLKTEYIASFGVFTTLPWLSEQSMLSFSFESGLIGKSVNRNNVNLLLLYKI